MKQQNAITGGFALEIIIRTTGSYAYEVNTYIDYSTVILLLMITNRCVIEIELT
jgi:hypothetical protein